MPGLVALPILKIPEISSTPEARGVYGPGSVSGTVRAQPRKGREGWGTASISSLHTDCLHVRADVRPLSLHGFASSSSSFELLLVKDGLFSLCSQKALKQ